MIILCAWRAADQKRLVRAVCTQYVKRPADIDFLLLLLLAIVIVLLLFLISLLRHAVYGTHMRIYTIYTYVYIYIYMRGWWFLYISSGGGGNELSFVVRVFRVGSPRRAPPTTSLQLCLQWPPLTPIRSTIRR